MSNSSNIKIENVYKLFLFSFSLAILTYGFALTNFTLSIDNEIPILSNFGLDLGRWGQNLIRYHLFNGHLQYFSFILSLFLFSISAAKIASLFKFENLSAYFFCALFITFPQISYQVIFSMMADVAGLGILISVYSVELFLKALETKTIIKKTLLFWTVALILMFALSIYQVLILVPITIYLILFFQKTFDDTFKLNLELKKTFIFGGILIASVIFYYLSVKIICPPIENGGYLSSYTTGNSDNAFSNFLTLLKNNLEGSAYYGEKLYFLVSLLVIILTIKFLLNKRYFIYRFLILFFLILSPFVVSYFITNGYHPPRLYLTSNIVFAFIIVFALNQFKSIYYNTSKIIVVVLIIITNIYFVTNLFYTANRIYRHDKKIAEKIDYTIQTKYPNFATTEKFVYFYGYFPYEYHQKFRLQNSEIFGGSYYNWDNGNNYRINKFFEVADIAEYKMIDTKEKFDMIKDSIDKMPIWPDYKSVKMIDNVVIVKLGKEKGMPISVE